MKKLSPKEFALSQIAPYFKDNSTCGITKDSNEKFWCCYLTPDGKMCVAGKNLLPEIREKHKDNYSMSIGTILDDANNDQSKVFIPEAVDILSKMQWEEMQMIHDRIATGDAINHLVKQLGLFTYEELEEYSNKTI
jgi:hypothetical protein